MKSAACIQQRNRSPGESRHPLPSDAPASLELAAYIAGALPTGQRIGNSSFRHTFLTLGNVGSKAHADFQRYSEIHLLPLLPAADRSLTLPCRLIQWSLLCMAAFGKLGSDDDRRLLAESVEMAA